VSTDLEQAPSPGRGPRACAWTNGKRFAARRPQARSGAHAERIVDDQQQEFSLAHIRGRAMDERIRQRQREQQ